jgi:ferric-dicitrate binding protein FerR (iron transport regulator)
MADPDVTSSPEEPDRQRAAQLRRLRARGASLDQHDWSTDPLVEALRATVTARARRRDVSPTTAQSARMWANIEAEMSPAQSPRTTRTLRAWLRRVGRAAVASSKQWAIAGAVLLLGMITAWWMLRPTAPVVRAEDTIQTYVTPAQDTVRLRPHSTLTRLPADSVLRYRLTGEAYFSVASPSPRPVDVVTDDARARVVGTRFVVRSWGDSTEVYLSEGTLRVSGAEGEGQARRLQAGQQVAVAPDGRISQPHPEPRPLYLSWLDGALVFERRPVSRILAELEYHYGLTLRVPERLRDQTLTGRIPLDTQVESLNDLGAVLGGHFQRTDANTYRFVDE